MGRGNVCTVVYRYGGEVGGTGDWLNYGQDLGCVHAVKVLVLSVGCSV